MPVDMAEYTIGVDLGGTNLRAAAIAATGKLLDKVSGLTNFTEGREAVLGRHRQGDRSHAQDPRRRTRGHRRGRARLHPHQGRLHHRLQQSAVSGELSGARRHLRAVWDRRVILENDANAAALGEKWMGAGREVDDLVLLTLGTGVGGGIISGGRVLRGYVGHGRRVGPHHGGSQRQSVRLRQPRAAWKNTPPPPPSRPWRGSCTWAKISLRRRLARWLRSTTRLGEKARAIWQVVGESLGAALATLVNTFNFPLYLLSGGMLPAWDFFAPHMLRVVEERSFTYRATKAETRIAQATLGNEAGPFRRGLFAVVGRMTAG